MNWACRRLATSGSRIAWISASDSFFWMSAGTLDEMTKPIQAEPSIPCTPASASVGISGSSAERLEEVTASAFSLPSLTMGMTAMGGSAPNCVSPDISEVSAAGDEG